jgi:hypothetical protein
MAHPLDKMTVDLAAVGMTAEQRANRRKWLGGSDANIIVNGTPEDVLDLWREKRGEVEDDSGGFDLLPLMGHWTEPLHRAWFAYSTGRPVTGWGTQVRSEKYPFMGCTLDGMTVSKTGQRATLQLKHLNEWLKREDLRHKYVAQLTHEAIVCGARYAVLSVIQGSATWWFEEFEVDPIFSIELIEAEKHFWHCVQTGEPPNDLAKIEPVIERPFVLREVDMTDGNQAPAWADLAKSWIEEDPLVRRRKDTDKAIKSMLMDDVGVATGSGISVTRNKAGSLTITQTDQPKRRKA